MTLHYHGTPITPRSKLHELAGRCFCVSYAAPSDVEVCHEIGQSVMLDNGAFSFWKQGTPTDWPGYYRWVEPWLDYRTTWAIVPDVIDGDERANDRLLKQWPFPRYIAAPVWHMHETIDRLLVLANGGWDRVCIGSSGQYATVGDERWHRRMHEAMDRLCVYGSSRIKLHMLRGMALSGGPYPFASVDSTAIARNHAGNSQGRAAKDVKQMADRLDSVQSPARWVPALPQLSLEAA